MEFPVGTIMLWLGDAGTIPIGWQHYALADGRFAKGVPASGTVEATGGTTEHLHVGGAIGSGGAHAHPEILYDTGPSGQDSSWLVTGTGYGITAADGNHYHRDQKMSLSTNSPHGHTRTASNVGVADNMPPYKQAIYIIRV